MHKHCQTTLNARLPRRFAPPNMTDEQITEELSADDARGLEEHCFAGIGDSDAEIEQGVPPPTDQNCPSGTNELDDVPLSVLRDALLAGRGHNGANMTIPGDSARSSTTATAFPI